MSAELLVAESAELLFLQLILAEKKEIRKARIPAIRPGLGPENLPLQPLDWREIPAGRREDFLAGNTEKARVRGNCVESVTFQALSIFMVEIPVIDDIRRIGKPAPAGFTFKFLH
jgi:hypothetical protein